MKRPNPPAFSSATTGAGAKRARHDVFGKTESSLAGLAVISILASGCIPFGDLEHEYRCREAYDDCAVESDAGTQTTQDSGTTTDAGVSEDAGTTDAGFSCDAGTTDCGGQCVDLTNHPGNCGACGRGCYGGACESGICQPVLVQHVMPPTTFFRPSLAVSNGELAFNLPDCTIGLAPVAPLSNVTVLTEPSCNNNWLITRVIKEDDQLWWVSDQEVGARLSGGGFAYRDTNTGSANRADLTKSGSTLLWTDRESGTLKSTDANMTGAVTSGSSAAPAGELAAIAELNGSVYFTNRVNGLLYRTNLALGAPVLTARPGMTLQLESCGGALYAASQDPDGGLLRVDPADGGLQRVGALKIPASAVACDDESLFWSTLDGAGASTIYATSLDGGVVRELARNQRRVESLAVDDCCVYWYGATADAGVIHRARKN